MGRYGSYWRRGALVQIEMVRRELFGGELLKAVYVRARSTSDAPGEVERQTAHVVVPALIVWALDDIFFELKWARWLQSTLPRGAHSRSA
jgi:hypothetical protein